MRDFNVEEIRNNCGAKIKVVGVGGGGGNMINRMIEENGGELNIDLIVANTDIKALDKSKAYTKIQLGEKKTKGLGAGMEPEVGREAALESYEEIKSALEYSDIVFISSGLGGGTGTGAAPVVAQAAKEVGALTVAVVTIPFDFEGNKRKKLAMQGLEELRKEVDSIVIINNQKLSGLVDRKAGLQSSFKVVDRVLARAVIGMITIVLNSGQNDINLDFADVKKVMKHRGKALMGMGEAQGDDAAQEAVKNAIQSPLLDDMSLKGAMGVLVHFKINPEYPFYEVEQAMMIVNEAADDDADIIFGTTSDENMEDDMVQVTIVATGFKNKEDKKQQVELEKKPISSNPFLSQRLENMRKVSGGFESEEASNMLETPTFMRYQMD